MEKEIEKEISEDEEPKVYEVGFHVVPTIAEEDVAPAVNTIRDLIESVNGMIIADGNPSLVKLAYPMDHIVANKKSIFDSANFGWIKFQTLAENIATIKDGLEKNENVFRFLIIKTVRENTLARKPAFRAKKPTSATKSDLPTDIVKKEKIKKEDISEEEVDKAIEELVVE